MKSIRRLFVGVVVTTATTPALFAVSPYISQVYEYQPAPGQFINLVPEVAEGEQPAQAAARELCGKRAGGGLICLGAFGGYVVFGFDHPVANVAGEYDFKIYGNAPMSGSSEPGIVSVSVDANNNGLPDDEWFELAGSNYSLDSTVKDYQITYYQPDSSATAVPDENSPAIVNKQYIKWSDNQGATGWLEKNSFHEQSYWPEWHADKTSLTFSGTRLASNAVDASGMGSYFVLETLPWGYVDNVANSAMDGFKIDWAVRSDGTPVKLTHIDFIKVHTGVIQTCGWIGETSTEIIGAEDLHPDAIVDVSSQTAISTESQVCVTMCGNKTMEVYTPHDATLDVFALSGERVMKGVSLHEGINVINMYDIAPGVYAAYVDYQVFKIVNN